MRINQWRSITHEHLQSFLHLLRRHLLIQRNILFKLSDLVQLYKDRLVQLKVISPSVHSTRLKDRILAHFPELQAFKEGCDFLLMSNEDVGSALRQVCENDADDEACILSRAAQIVRKEILNKTTQFDDVFPANC